jgi:hypothetical protein
MAEVAEVVFCSWCDERASIHDPAHADPDDPGSYLCEECRIDRANREAYTRQFLQPALRAPAHQIRANALQEGNLYNLNAVVAVSDQADHIVEIQFLAKLVAQAENGGRSWSGSALFALRRWANSRENLSMLSQVLNNAKGHAFMHLVPGVNQLPVVVGLPSLHDVFRAALLRLRSRVVEMVAQYPDDAELVARLIVRIDAI